MTVKEALAVLENSVAPVSVSDEFCKKYDQYDNSGIIIDCGNKVTSALFSLDLSEAAVAEAKRTGADLIVTHHPAIYGGISRYDLKNDSHARAIAECLKNGISVISMHLNFDAAPEGIDEFLMRGIGGTCAEILAPVSGGGYGRAYDIKPCALKKLIEAIAAEFKAQVLVHGERERNVKRVASFCGAGCDDAAVAFAKRERADAIVSSDLSHHRILELVESGITVVQLTHYAAESYGFNKIYESVSDKLKIKTAFFRDERFV